jgi:hypothetical protein
MGNINWNDIDIKVKEFEDSLEIPDGNLNGVNCVLLKNEADLFKIPNQGGCYWIWTNKNIIHTFHKSKLPDGFDGGEIIYNGIAKDDIRGRIKKHLFGKIEEGMSAISMDLILTDYKGSHRKKALADKGNTVYFNNIRIRNKEDLLMLNLSNIENGFIKQSDHPIYFRNGINISESKYLDFSFRVYFLSGFKSA